ncbi:CMRF35-like molecule 3 [Grus japonensis]|uniref:CMRF35-like molecule 3 n=1 Tax=Grus japonensis TaxID=30415 RepID=A0ABC9XJW8_GRUJA
MNLPWSKCTSRDVFPTPLSLTRIVCKDQTTAPGDKVLGDSVSIRDVPSRHMFVVTMENLTVEDGDQYWCGIQMAWYDPMFPVMVSVVPAAWAMERKRDKDLQVTASGEQAATSNNIYVNREWELSSPEDDYENSPAKWQDYEKGDDVSVSRAPELIYMNTH